MINRIRLKTPSRWVVAAILLGLCSLLIAATPRPQEEPEDGARRIWNKRFEQARSKTKVIAHGSEA